MMKVCSSCRTPKSYREFYNNRSKSDGFHNQCKECSAKSSEKYRKKNQLELTRKARIRRWKNIQRVRERRREYRNRNLDRFHEYEKGTRQRCATKIKARQARWFQKNKERLRIKNREYVRIRYQTNENYRERIKLKLRAYLRERRLRQTAKHESD
jgi:hypothetical protein